MSGRRDGLIYASDWNAGLHVLEYEDAAIRLGCTESVFQRSQFGSLSKKTHQNKSADRPIKSERKRLWRHLMRAPVGTGW